MIEKEAIKEQFNWFTVMRPYRVANFDPYVLKPDAERALKPLASFRECAKDCPEMIVIPAGEFTMGSPATEQGRYANEGPQHKVTIAKPFAVSKFDVTFADWDACVSVGACPKARATRGYRARHKAGHQCQLGRRPDLCGVALQDDRASPIGCSRKPNGNTRLAPAPRRPISGATTSARTTPTAMGAAASGTTQQTSPVGSFAANQFGLYDMAGNVWQWVQDCLSR